MQFSWSYYVNIAEGAEEVSVLHIRLNALNSNPFRGCTSARVWACWVGSQVSADWLARGADRNKQFLREVGGRAREVQSCNILSS